jgi:outer membrane lipase/esterase
MTFIKTLVAAAAIAVTSVASAGNIFFFGDSLSDTGNLSLIAPGNPKVTPQAPYQPGQYTDIGGQVWTVEFAAKLGQAGASRPSLLGGNNYAIAGARTYSLPTAPIGVDNQLLSFRADLAKRNTVVTQNDLFVIMIGGNDLAQFVLSQSTVGPQGSLANLGTIITDLYKTNNARHFLVANMPNFGATPFFQNLVVPGVPAGAIVAGAAAARAGYNAGFNQLIAGLGSQLAGIDLDVLDFTKLDALNLATYGITNTKDTCFVYPPSIAVAPNCSTYAYSDDFHPTAVVHSIIAQEAVERVPVPASIALLGLGLMGLVGVRRKA